MIHITENSRYIALPGTAKLYDRNRILLVVLIPLTITLMQISAVNNVLFAIRQTLCASETQLQWILSGYALAIGLILVPAGRLGDIFGRSGAFATGLAIFSIASFLIGLSESPAGLNTLRFIQGLGSGILAPQSTGLIQQYFREEARAKAFAFFGVAVSVSVAVGPLLSGALIGLFGNETGWRASFMINAPLGMAGVVLSLFWLPFGTERKKFGQRGGKIKYVVSQLKTALDLPGIFFLALAVLSVMLPFMTPGSALKWIGLPAGAAALGIWVWWENRYRKRGHLPLVDLRLFGIKTFSYSMLISTIQFLGSTSIFAVFAIFLQNGLHVSAWHVGLITLPSAIASAFGAVIAGKYAYRHGRGIQVLALACLILGLLGTIFTTRLNYYGYPFGWFAVPLCVIGIGAGMMGSSNQTQAMMDVPPEDGGTAGGVLQTGQRMATAIGNALVTAVFFTFSRPVPAGHEKWYLGIVMAYAAICVLIFIALIIAVRFRHEGRRREKKTA